MRLVNLHETDIGDVLESLPQVARLDMAADTAGRRDDLFLTALGFEERCLWIPESLAEQEGYRARQGVYFEYDTNSNDNRINAPRLITAMQSFADGVRSMQIDADGFVAELRAVLAEVCGRDDVVRVTFDISVCSSRAIVLVLSMLLEFDLELRMVYSEANVYHPTKEEYENEPSKWSEEEEMGLTHGVSSVPPSPEHPGRLRDLLPQAVIAFPTFKRERIRAIIAEVDPSLLMRPGDRVVWLLGRPHLEEDWWRTDAQRKTNGLTGGALCYEVSTFDYRETVAVLERVYQPLDCKYHVSIAPLGSKMQSVGVVLFWYIRPEVAIAFATPKEYNAGRYSEGCKAVWRIEFGSTSELRRLLSTVGNLQKLTGRREAI